MIEKESWNLRNFAIEFWKNAPVRERVKRKSGIAKLRNCELRIDSKPDESIAFLTKLLKGFLQKEQNNGMVCSSKNGEFEKWTNIRQVTDSVFHRYLNALFALIDLCDRRIGLGFNLGQPTLRCWSDCVEKWCTRHEKWDVWLLSNAIIGVILVCHKVVWKVGIMNDIQISVQQT